MNCIKCFFFFKWILQHQKIEKTKISYGLSELKIEILNLGFTNNLSIYVKIEILGFSELDLINIRQSWVFRS